MKKKTYRGTTGRSLKSPLAALGVEFVGVGVRGEVEPATDVYLVNGLEYRVENLHTTLEVRLGVGLEGLRCGSGNESRESDGELHCGTNEQTFS
ncbi:hypothetical protein BJY04DRAFT_201385 [Aspergillus karnatakaensis]|uniref:uncharacterized protein n=1 Tax=Aspergillus karnatakaensis TaxID=1810916 RepID=UPI003CCC939F